MGHNDEDADNFYLFVVPSLWLRHSRPRGVFDIYSSVYKYYAHQQIDSRVLWDIISKTISGKSGCLFIRKENFNRVGLKKIQERKICNWNYRR